MAKELAMSNEQFNALLLKKIDDIVTEQRCLRAEVIESQHSLRDELSKVWSQLSKISERVTKLEENEKYLRYLLGGAGLIVGIGIKMGFDVLWELLKSGV